MPFNARFTRGTAVLAETTDAQRSD